MIETETYDQIQKERLKHCSLTRCSECKYKNFQECFIAFYYDKGFKRGKSSGQKKGYAMARREFKNDK